MIQTSDIPAESLRTDDVLVVALGERQFEYPIATVRVSRNRVHVQYSNVPVTDKYERAERVTIRQR